MLKTYILTGIAALVLLVVPAQAQLRDNVPWSNPTTPEDCRGLEAQAKTECLNKLMAYNSSAFGIIDRNHDRRLTLDEITAGIGEPEFDPWLRGANGRASRAEFDRRHAPRARFDAWDRDDSDWLSDTEISTGLLELWDKDGNGWLSEAEFDLGLNG